MEWPQLRSRSRQGRRTSQQIPGKKPENYDTILNRLIDFYHEKMVEYDLFLEIVRGNLMLTWEFGEWIIRYEYKK